MPPRTLSLTLALAGLGLLTTHPAAAQSGSVLIAADHTGWYNSAGEHSASNSNYIVGGPQTYGPFARNFFEFDLSGISPYTQITAANLQVIQGGSVSEYPYLPSLSYVLYDVSTQTPVLVSTQSGRTGTDIYQDLGDGRSYGTFSVSTDYQYEDVLTFALNQAALEDLNAHRGDTFAVGGALDLSGVSLLPYGEEYTFAATSGAGDGRGFGATLDLTTVPETSAVVSLGLLLALGAGGLAVTARRRKAGGSA